MRTVKYGESMADASELEAKPPKERRFFWPGGLSVRLLLVTVAVVVFANLIILPQSLAAFQEGWLQDRLSRAEIAVAAADANPGKPFPELSQILLRPSEVLSIAIQADGVRRLVLAAPYRIRATYLIDLRQTGPVAFLLEPIRTLTTGEAVVRVVDRPRYVPAEFVEIVIPTAPLKKALLDQLGVLLLGAAFTSLLSGAVVYFSLAFLLVRPMQRITRAMERFRADPEDSAAHLQPSGRHDEIGRAEAELERMQADLRAALQSRARLAALGEAVAKINHDLRNMLTSAQIASERLAQSGDPQVARALPRLERALDRAIQLASNVLTFGKSEEPAPVKKSVAVRAALEAAAEDARFDPGGVRLVTDIPAGARVEADPDQLHRILVNLLRNAREAIAGQEGRDEVGKVEASLGQTDGQSVLRLADDGPGLPERARNNLFQPFAGSARRGGTGLGLAIARELAQAHGGDLVLVQTSADGAVFELRLPGAPTPATPRRRKASETPGQ
jgi:signal transduction histidine kinase